MDTHEQQSPCAADALFGIRKITVRGKSVGIARLCDAITEVQGRGLAREEEIKTALIECVSRHNYIPDALRAEYAQALLAEYYVTECRCGG
jgi:hypothetical protein